MTYKSENEIVKIVRLFESGLIRREDWRHAEHLTVAIFYVSRHDFDTALVKMRDGIFNLLKAFEVDLSKEMPYHETLTVFWMRTVSKFTNSSGKNSILDLTNEVLNRCGDKDLPLKFYRRDLLFSDRARKEFVEPDLQKI